MSANELTKLTATNATAYAVQNFQSGANAHRIFVATSVIATMLRVYGWETGSKPMLRKDADTLIEKAVNQVDACRATRANWLRAYTETVTIVAKANHRNFRESIKNAASLEEALELFKPWYAEHGFKDNASKVATAKTYADACKAFENALAKLADSDALPPDALDAGMKVLLRFTKVADIGRLEKALKDYKRSALKVAHENAAQAPDAVETFDATIAKAA